MRPSGNTTPTSVAPGRQAEDLSRDDDGGEGEDPREGRRLEHSTDALHHRAPFETS